MDERLVIPEWLLERTFEVQHNPNCPSPFLVRMVTPGTGRLDSLPPNVTKDTIGYGKTLTEAADNVRWVLWLKSNQEL